MKTTMRNKLITAFITSCLISGSALAGDDCTDPVTDWQPKERLHQMMLNQGWDVKRIKVDDGCYEVKGRDRNGHEVKAKFSPASLEILELDIKFEDSADTSDYLNVEDQNNPKKSDASLHSKRKASKNKTKATIE